MRANNIFRKLGHHPEQVRGDFASLSAEQINEFFAGEAGDDLWALVYFASRLDDAAQAAAVGFEPTLVAKHAFQLAKQFNLFYHNHHILSEPDEARRLLLLMVADVARRKLEQALQLLGIETPERM